ncbi:MAG: arsinothricin resistance N-acetyltransferase ArsN1 family B [Pseudohongiellaceae bacterium]
MIRSAKKIDADAIAKIYNHYILSTVITFEESEVTSQEIAQRIEENQNLRLPWLVFEDGGNVVGYAYASPWKGRCAYRYTVEVTVYLAPENVKKGIGSQLYTTLFVELGKLGYRTVIGGISLPNSASIALHERFGMKKVGHFSEVGYKFDSWVDVGYWQGSLNSNV